MRVRAGPVIPKDSSLANNIVWLMVSKALVKSKNTEPINLPLSIELLIKSVNAIKAKLVELPGRKPNWKGFNKLY